MGMHSSLPHNDVVVLSAPKEKKRTAWAMTAFRSATTPQCPFHAGFLPISNRNMR
jgi:hypothetical protein